MLNLLILKKTIHFLVLFGLICNMILMSNTSLKLGDSTCLISITKKSKQNYIGIISLHENESTSKDAYNLLPVNSPFFLIQIIQNKNRLLRYDFNKKHYFFDPNRIFSKRGIRYTLEKYNKTYPNELVDKIQSFSDSLLLLIIPKNQNRRTISIHNNTDGNYSISTYEKSINAKNIFISSKSDPDDFYLVTSFSDFEFFKKSNYNVVLQSKNAEDDGSLSIYCQKHDISYINIESQNGHQKKQFEMLKLCSTLVQETP